nr:hypothetical protein Iba_chr04fCG11450 [Ipomoea batatas]
MIVVIRTCARSPHSQLLIRIPFSALHAAPTSPQTPSAREGPSSFKATGSAKRCFDRDSRGRNKQVQGGRSLNGRKHELRAVRLAVPTLSHEAIKSLVPATTNECRVLSAAPGRLDSHASTKESNGALGRNRLKRKVACSSCKAGKVEMVTSRLPSGYQATAVAKKGEKESFGSVTMHCHIGRRQPFAWELAFMGTGTGFFDVHLPRPCSRSRL